MTYEDSTAGGNDRDTRLAGRSRPGSHIFTVFLQLFTVFLQLSSDLPAAVLYSVSCLGSAVR